MKNLMPIRMQKMALTLSGWALLQPCTAQFFKKEEPFAHTFSIVARDSATGNMAVGVQSHYFSVGTAVSWG
ncbi:MAG TPA: DUF1028 domain-containing protein, partial [Phnomibacter sp.]|nr:DUF1028 domain-containing protein [Phnomibacter sp.]